MTRNVNAGTKLETLLLQRSHPTSKIFRRMEQYDSEECMRDASFCDNNKVKYELMWRSKRKEN